MQTTAKYMVSVNQYNDINGDMIRRSSLSNLKQAIEMVAVKPCVYSTTLTETSAAS